MKKIHELMAKEHDLRIEDALELPDTLSRFLSNRKRVTIKSYMDEATSKLIWTMRPHRQVEGPPGHCHGGFIATILDECQGTTAWWNGKPVLAATLNVRYRRSVPLSQDFLVIGEVTRLEKSRVYTQGHLYDKEGRLMASSSGLFMQIPISRLQKHVDEKHIFQPALTFYNFLKQGLPIRKAVELTKAGIAASKAS